MKCLFQTHKNQLSAALIIAITFLFGSALLVPSAAKANGAINEYFPFSLLCAPSDLQNNLTNVDQALLQLAHTPQFANASTYKRQVDQITTISDPHTKMAAYMSMIDLTTERQLVEFLGTRDGDDLSKYIHALETNLRLTVAQSQMVQANIRSAMRGNLQ